MSTKHRPLFSQIPGPMGSHYAAFKNGVMTNDWKTVSSNLNLNFIATVIHFCNFLSIFSTFSTDWKVKERREEV